MQGHPFLRSYLPVILMDGANWHKSGKPA